MLAKTCLFESQDWSKHSSNREYYFMHKFAETLRDFFANLHKIFRSVFVLMHHIKSASKRKLKQNFFNVCLGDENCKTCLFSNAFLRTKVNAS